MPYFHQNPVWSSCFGSPASLSCKLVNAWNTTVLFHSPQFTMYLGLISYNHPPPSSTFCCPYYHLSWCSFLHHFYFCRSSPSFHLPHSSWFPSTDSLLTEHLDAAAYLLKPKLEIRETQMLCHSFLAGSCSSEQTPCCS